MEPHRSASELMRGAPVVIAPFATHSDVVIIPSVRQYLLDATPSALTPTAPFVSGVSFFSTDRPAHRARPAETRRLIDQCPITR